MGNGRRPFDLEPAELTAFALTPKQQQYTARDNEDGPYWAWPIVNGKPNPNYWGGERFTTAKGFKVVL